MPSYDFDQNNITQPAESTRSSNSSSAIIATSATQLMASPPLFTHIENNVRQYFNEPGSQDSTDVYDLMLQQFERPLLTVIFELTKGNQTHMAQILGLNRGTLRKKLKRYDFIK